MCIKAETQRKKVNMVEKVWRCIILEDILGKINQTCEGGYCKNAKDARVYLIDKAYALRTKNFDHSLSIRYRSLNVIWNFLEHKYYNCNNCAHVNRVCIL